MTFEHVQNPFAVTCTETLRNYQNMTLQDFWRHCNKLIEIGVLVFLMQNWVIIAWFLHNFCMIFWQLSGYCIHLWAMPITRYNSHMPHQSQEMAFLLLRYFVCISCEYLVEVLQCCTLILWHHIFLAWIHYTVTSIPRFFTENMQNRLLEHCSLMGLRLNRLAISSIGWDD